MNLKRVTIYTLLTLLISSCSKPLPSKGTTTQENLSIAPKPEASDAFVGDPMPFFDNGKMNVFFLENAPTMGPGYHPISLFQTEDYLHYDEKGVVLNYVNSIFDPEVALGTGSIVKKDDTYHFFYTGHNSSKSSGLPYYEKILHAKSTDLLNWERIPEDGFYGRHNDFRDPYVLYMENEQCYYMLVTTRVNDKGVIALYKSDDLSEWIYDSIFYENTDETYNMECPTLINYNNYWYLAFSEQGNNRITHYRYKRNLSDKVWIVPSVDYFDSRGLYAGRLEKDDANNLFVFGWCAVKEGANDYSDFDWGGNLIVHQLQQNEFGELKPKMMSNYKNGLSHQVSYKTIKDKKVVQNYKFNSSFKSTRLESLSDKVTYISTKLFIEKLSGSGGITFNQQADNEYGTLALEFNFDTDQINFYNDCYKSDKGTPQLSVHYSFNLKEDIDINLIIDGQIAILYVDENIALTTRMYDMVNQPFSFYGDGATFQFKEVKFYE